jgi:hypothetical protein
LSDIYADFLISQFVADVTGRARRAGRAVRLLALAGRSAAAQRPTETIMMTMKNSSVAASIAMTSAAMIRPPCRLQKRSVPEG